MSKLDQLRQLAAPILGRHGCALVLATFNREPGGRVLRLLIEKEGADPAVGSGVDHALCSAVSRELSAAIDAEDLVAEAFVLEVSSPGIERPLVGPDDYARFAGRKARIGTMRAVDGRKRFTGLLGGFEAGCAILTSDDGARIAIPLDLVTKANLVFDPLGIKVKAGEE